MLLRLLADLLSSEAFEKFDWLQSPDHIWQYYYLGDNSRTWQDNQDYRKPKLRDCRVILSH
jgi:hypothetical protein